MRTPGLEALRALTPGRQAAVIALVLGLTVGLSVAPLAYDAAIDPSPDQVAVVPLVGTVDGSNAADVSQRLIRARMDPSVKAVVLHVNSPGGLAVAGEELFMQVDRTAQKKPLVVVSDLLVASAAYKASLPAEKIYVKPQTAVGSIGTLLIRPAPLDPLDPVIHTGPRKLEGDTPRGYEYSIERSGAGFVDQVMEYRGDEITVSREELAHARIYGGFQAVQFGLADEVTDVQGAIQSAADLAGLDTYQIRTMEYETEVRFLDRTNFAHATQENKTMIGIQDLVDPPEERIVPQVLMLPHAAVAGEFEEQSDRDVNATAPASDAPKEESTDG